MKTQSAKQPIYLNKDCHCVTIT